MEKKLEAYTWLLVVLACTCVISVNGENLAFVSSNNNKIYKATLPDNIGETIAFTSLIDVTGNEPTQLGYDPVERRLYWADYDNPQISRCDLNGNNRKDFTTAGDTLGLALDVVNRRVYYTIPYDDVGIYSIDMGLVGPATRLLAGTPVDADYYEPHHLVYGSESMKLYYTVEWCIINGVEVVNVDGSDRKTLVLEDYEILEYPRHILLEEREQMLYYIETEFGTINRINFTESNPEKNIIYTGGSESRGLAAYKDDIYWCDNEDDVMYRTAKDGSDDAFSPVQVSATFDGGSIVDCLDVHFYVEVPCVSNLFVSSDSSSQLSVTWDLPSVLCPADWYRIEYQPMNVYQCDSDVESSTTLEWQTQNFRTLEGLKPYTTYRVSVTAGLGPDSSVAEEGVSMETTQNTAEAAPSQSPPEVKYVLTDTSVIFTWQDIPCIARRGLIDHYEYTILSNGVVIASGMNITREVAVDRPPCGTVTFEVAGVNSAGMSDYTTLSFEVVSTDSFMPNTGLQINGITETSADISWYKTVCPPFDYTVKDTLVKLGQCNRNVEFNYGTVDKNGDASVNLVGLEPGSEYNIVISSMNNDGEQRQLRGEFVTPESVPSQPPQNLQITYGIGGSAQVTWDAIPCESRGGSSFYYSYKVLVDGAERRSGQTSETSFIELGSPYHNADGLVEFMVAGATEAGIGTSSKVSYDVNLAGLCPQSCGIHGICDARTNACKCFPGYKGDSCETTICIASCLNGGECSATGSCLCPAGLMGTRCQLAQLVSNGLPVSTVEGQFAVISCDGVPAVFTGDLNVEGSTSRDEMLRKIQPLLNQFIGTIAGVISVGNVQFSSGSIVVSFTVTADSGTTASEIDNGINNLIQSAPAISGLTIDPGSARAFTDALCTQDYCKNGGTCIEEISGLGIECTCPSGYVGLQCDEKESNLSSGAVAGIYLGVFGFVIGAMLIGICFCMYMRQRQSNNPQMPPNINTLDLATSPYTYPRIDARRVNNLNTLTYYN